MVDEKLLLELLNTTPIVDGEPRDDLVSAGTEWLADHDLPESDAELSTLLDVRRTLQDVVRGDAVAASLGRFVDGVHRSAAFAGDGVTWTLELPAGRTGAARAVLAWDELRVSSPGRLRPCANPECRRFLIDHSKPNSARWCSMALCGNRMKARRHYRRTRAGAED